MEAIMPGDTGKFTRHQGKLVLPGAWGYYRGLRARVINITETFDKDHWETKIVLRWSTPESSHKDPSFEIKEVRPEDQDLVLD